MANAVVNRQVNVYINSGEAAKAYDKLIAKEKVLNAELAKTTDPKRIKVLTGELNKLREPIERAAKKMSGELAPSIRELELATRKFLNEFKKTGDPETLRKFQAFNGELQAAKRQITGMEDASNKLTKGGIFTAAFWANLASQGIMKVTSLIVTFFSGAIQEALDADTATRRLSSTLDNLGRSDVFDRITRKAEEMAQQFRYLDNDDVVGVFNKLIDYGKLTEKQMDELLPVIINFAAKSQISLEESTSVIIKALEGNAKALKEYGINIKDAGTEAERMNIIMTTLKEKVDGAGEAFQNSAQGGIASAKQRFNDLKEEIGNGLIPVMNELLSWTNKVITGLGYLGSKAAEVGRNLVDDIGTFFTDGRQGVRENQAARALERRNRIEAGAAQMAADKNTANQLQKILDDQFKRKAVLNSLFGLGELTEKTLERETKRVDELIRVYGKALELKSAADASANETLGIGGAGGGGKAEVDSKVNKALEERLRLLADLKKLEFDLSLTYLSQFEKDAKQLDKKYEELRTRAKNDKELLIRIETLYLTERMQLIDSYVDREVQAWKNAQGKVMKETDKLFLDNLQKLKDRGKEVLEGGNNGSVKRGTALTESNQQNDDEQMRAKVQQYIGYASQIADLFAQFGQAQTDRENAELERDRRINDRKIRNLDSRLRKGVISQQQYDREVQKIEKDQEKREKEIRLKQFRRQQRQQLLQAIINTAEGVTEALPNLVLAAIVGAAGAVQIGLIAGQKAPEFAAGGKLGGRSHATGGNAVIDGSGRKIAEVEAGEGIVNKRTMADGRQYSVSGTPSQIISRLNGMYGRAWEGGATLVPHWRSNTPQRMNYAAMKGVYAAGGTMGSPSAQNEAAENPVFENLVMVISNMERTLASLQANGIAAYTVLTQQEKQQARLDAIRSDATLRG